MARLPRAEAEHHIKAFEAAGWRVARITGSHYVLIKDSVDYHLSIPYHRGQTVKAGLLRGLIRDAGLTTDEYLAFFKGRKRRSG